MRRLLRLTMATAVAAGLLVGASPSGARTLTRLDLAGFSHLVVDADHSQVFLSQGSVGGVLVTDNGGGTVQQETSLTGTTDLELDPAHATVWAAMPNGHAIGSIDTATLAATTHTLTTECPTQLAPVGSEVWFVNACSGQTPELEEFDPQTPAVTDVLALTAGAVIATNGTSRIYVARPGSSSSEYAIDAYDTTDTPSATIAVENAHVPGAVPLELAVSADGARLASSHGQLLGTSDLQVIQSWPGPVAERGVAIDSTGLVAVGAKSSVTAYQEGNPKAYDSTPLPTTNLSPLGLGFGPASTLYSVSGLGSNWYLSHVTFHGHVSMTIKVNHPRAAWGQTEHLTVHTTGIPDGAPITLVTRTGGDTLGRPITGQVSHGTAHFTSHPVRATEYLIVRYSQAWEPRHVTEKVHVVLVLNATQTPHGYLREGPRAYVFRAGHPARFRTHLRKWFPGACLTSIVYYRDPEMGEWKLYARVPGCLPIPSTGVNRIYLPGSLAIPFVQFKQGVRVYQSQHAYKRHRGSLVIAKPIFFHFVK